MKHNEQGYHQNTTKMHRVRGNMTQLHTNTIQQLIKTVKRLFRASRNTPKAVFACLGVQKLQNDYTYGS